MIPENKLFRHDDFNRKISHETYNNAVSKITTSREKVVNGANGSWKYDFADENRRELRNNKNSSLLFSAAGKSHFISPIVGKFSKFVLRNIFSFGNFLINERLRIELIHKWGQPEIIWQPSPATSTSLQSIFHFFVSHFLADPSPCWRHFWKNPISE